MTKPATSFHLFGRLPPELRLQIWQYCLPYRVFELDFSLDEYVFWSYREYLDPPLTFAMYPLTYNASKWASATHQPATLINPWMLIGLQALTSRMPG
ncbi:hypothetical protein KCU87_g471, partial [Aureobasidium melanogenum]